MREITIQETESGQRLDKFLRRYLPGAGSGFLYKMLRKKNILLNEKKAEGKEILQAGDSIRVFFTEETIRHFQKTGDSSADQAVSEANDPASASAHRKDSDPASGSARRKDNDPASASTHRKDSDPAQGSARRKVNDPISGPALRKADIIFEDRDVLVINKPAGVLSQGAHPGDWSLVEMVREYLRGTGELTDESALLYMPGVLNRLDRNTSGLVLAAKNLAAARELSELLRTRQIRKEYLALACGRIDSPGHLQGWLTKNTAANQVRITDTPALWKGAEHVTEAAAKESERAAGTSAGGAEHIMKTAAKDSEGAAVAAAGGAERIETAWTPIVLCAGEVLFGNDKESFAGRQLPSYFTLLRVDLITGKTHQIRAHLASDGHSLAGDVKYGNRAVADAFRRAWGLDRQFLHAERMTFPADMRCAPQLAGRTLEAPLPRPLLQIAQTMQCSLH